MPDSLRRAAFAGLLSLVPAAAAAQQVPDAEPLYQRMGGYDVIAAVVDDFLVRFDADPRLIPFLGGVNAPAGARIRQHFVDFLCAETGGPCLYNGRDMSAAHDGLPIEGGHFDAVIRHFDAALRAQNVPAPERDELLTRLRALKTQVVSRRDL